MESGVIRAGETVEIWDGGRLIAIARATVELICSRRHDPASIGLLRASRSDLRPAGRADLAGRRWFQFPEGTDPVGHIPSRNWSWYR
jgi:hypothetical protein